MKNSAARIVAILGLLAIGAGGFVYAQQHDHSQHQNQANAVSAEDDVAIFCPTMKTGQLCSHGTANVLQLSGKKQEQWIAIARKYDKAVEALKKVLANYPEAHEIVWVQEEPLNMGAWSYMSSQLTTLPGLDIELNVIARPARPSPATGFSDLFQFEQERIIEGALRTTVKQYGGKHGG